ncbi:UNVERIFIED_CONTAM: hypothetical protein Sangu_0604000 [Sesamum angustifolium]|uniref:CCHC-type domain-containing protein n=1 Tax=Sesamum angustifolium TaxID=2727405 RepID=A0AAW2QB90_9LAMI
MFRISSQLKLCGEQITDADMLEKTFSTFHASNMLLQQQYREKGFTKYFELISCLLVAEQNNELLLKNHEFRPTGSAPFAEVNVATRNHYNHESYRGRGRGRGRNHSRGCGRDRGHGLGYRGGHSKNISFHQKWKNGEEKSEKENSGQTSKHVETSCYRCGGKGHWSRTCRTPKHLIDLYQESLKNKNKKIETNFVDDESDGYIDMTHLDVADFFADPNGKIDHLIGDGSVSK